MMAGGMGDSRVGTVIIGRIETDEVEEEKQYEILELLSDTNVSQVYLAGIAGSGFSADDLVAIKFVKRREDATSDREASERFRREREAQRIVHPHIVDVLFEGIEDDVDYYGMRFYPGRLDLLAKTASTPYDDEADFTQAFETLTSVIEHDEQDLEERVRLSGISGEDNLLRILRILEDVAIAVEHVHEKELVHRDIKPSNIFAEVREGEWRGILGDFGIAKGIDSTRLTVTGTNVGSRAYMAPERFKVDEYKALPSDAARFEVDKKSDMWSLGMTLRETVTGEILQLEEALPVRDLNQGIPSSYARKLDRMIWYMLEKNPNDRYESARQIREDFESLRNGEYLKHAPSYGEKRREYRNRKIFTSRNIFRTAAAAVVLVATGLGVSHYRSAEYALGEVIDNPSDENIATLVSRLGPKMRVMIGSLDEGEFFESNEGTVQGDAPDAGLTPVLLDVFADLTGDEYFRERAEEKIGEIEIPETPAEWDEIGSFDYGRTVSICNAANVSLNYSAIADSAAKILLEQRWVVEGGFVLGVGTVSDGVNVDNRPSTAGSFTMITDCLINYFERTEQDYDKIVSNLSQKIRSHLMPDSSFVDVVDLNPDTRMHDLPRTYPSAYPYQHFATTQAGSLLTLGNYHEILRPEHRELIYDVSIGLGNFIIANQDSTGKVTKLDYRFNNTPDGIINTDAAATQSLALRVAAEFVDSQTAQRFRDAATKMENALFLYFSTDLEEHGFLTNSFRGPNDESVTYPATDISFFKSLMLRLPDYLPRIN